MVASPRCADRSRGVGRRINLVELQRDQCDEARQVGGLESWTDSDNCDVAVRVLPSGKIFSDRRKQDKQS